MNENDPIKALLDDVAREVVRGGFLVRDHGRRAVRFTST